jgi:osmotically-inducible protein OsmY
MKPMPVKVTHRLASAQTLIRQHCTIRIHIEALQPGDTVMKHAMKMAPFIILMGLMMGLAGCASKDTRSSTGEYIDDTAITTKVKAAIFNESSLSSSEINVETFKSVVQLSGFVSSQSDINTAVLLAQNVSGVESVVNSMRLR